MFTLLSFLAKAMPSMPNGSGWLTLVALILLGAAAAIDARTARIPDPFILIGLLITTATQGFLVDWSIAGEHLAVGLVSGMLLYMINEVWYRLKKHDAFGMGDAKWTVLAVTCFEVLPALFAWVIGACLALGWMGVMRINKKPITHVHFSPFLFVGLCAGIYWLRLR